MLFLKSISLKVGSSFSYSKQASEPFIFSTEEGRNRPRGNALFTLSLSLASRSTREPCRNTALETRPSNATLTENVRVTSHLQVVLPVDHQPVAEHVPHDQQVGLLVVYADSIHSQELRQQRAAMTLDDVLQKKQHSFSHGGGGERGQGYNSCDLL